MIVKIKEHKILFITLMVVVVIFIYFNSRFVMKNLHHGEYISSYVSPSDTYRLNSYRYSGGATVDWSVRVEVVNNRTLKKENIYVKYHEKDVTIEWIDEDIVVINDVVLNIHTQVYHYDRIINSILWIYD